MEIILITMAVVGGTIGVLGTVQEAEQAEFNEEMARRNAAQQQANAEQQRNLTQIQVNAQNAEVNAEVDAVRRRNQAILAQNRAEAGMLGIDSTGSSLLLAIDNAENAELEALEVQRTGRNKARQLQYEGDVQAYNYEVAAQNSLLEAGHYKKAKKYAAVQTVFDSVSGGVSGAASGYELGVKGNNALASTEWGKSKGLKKI